MLSDLGTLDSDADVFASPHIAVRDGGVLVGSSNGFWDLPSGEEPRWVAADEDGLIYQFLVGDLDRDGAGDVITFGEVDRHTNDSVTYVAHFAVWQQRGGSFTRRAAVDSHNNEPNDQFGLGDVDGDGDLDLVTTRVGTPTVYRNDGAFGFEPEEAGSMLGSDAANSEVLGVNLYDADGDDVLDLVSIHDNYPSGSKSVFVAFRPGDGHGQFGKESVSLIGEGGLTPITPVGDVTGDGHPDLVLWSRGREGETLLVATGLGDGSFAPPEPVDAPSSDRHRTGLADTDADGTLDIVIAAGESILVLRATGDLVFEPEVYAVPTGSVGGIFVRDATPTTPARLHALLRVAGCREECNDACSGQCLIGVCVHPDRADAGLDGGA